LSIHSGECDLFVSKGESTRPSHQNSIDRNVRYGHKVIEINKNTLKKANLNLEKGLEGVFLVGVYGSSKCHYELVWYNDMAREIKA
jgi:hypothetical protein